MNYTSSSSFGA